MDAEVSKRLAIAKAKQALSESIEDSAAGDDLDAQERRKNIILADSLAKAEYDARVGVDGDADESRERDLRSVLDAVAAEQLRRSAAYLLGATVDVQPSGPVSVADENNTLPARVTDSLNALNASDPDALPRLVKLKDSLDLYEGGSKLDDHTAGEIESERATRVAQFKSTLDDDTLVFLFCFLCLIVF